MSLSRARGIVRRPYGWSVFAAVVAPLLSGGYVTGQPPPASNTQPLTASSPVFPCGVMALYALSRLENIPTNLTAIDAQVSMTGKTGHSLSELREAAHAFGLELTGVHLSSADWPLDRPALVRLKQGPLGHFVVIRPVGHSGKLVQIVDGIHCVEVLDAQDLFSSTEWAGEGLIPVRPADSFPAWTSTNLAVFGAAASCWLLLRRLVAFARKPPKAEHGARSRDITDITGFPVH